jgi:hypothetical protein
MRCVMDGSSFTIPGETPCADPHAGCCGGWGLETLGYPIITVMNDIGEALRSCGFDFILTGYHRADIACQQR